MTDENLFTPKYLARFEQQYDLERDDVMGEFVIYDQLTGEKMVSVRTGAKITLGLTTKDQIKRFGATMQEICKAIHMVQKEDHDETQAAI